MIMLAPLQVVTVREESVSRVPRGSTRVLWRHHVLIMSTGVTIGVIEGSSVVCCGNMLFGFACRMSSCRSGVGCSLLPVAVSRRIVFQWELNLVLSVGPVDTVGLLLDCR
jgi:hypothetical protein